MNALPTRRARARQIGRRVGVACGTVFAIALTATGSARADDKAAAEVLFDEAKALVGKGDYAAACPKFEASVRLDPTALGAHINMADCNEHIGKLASAWAEYREVEEQARARSDAKREQYAHDHALALSSRLVRLQVQAPKIAGLIVRRDGEDITASLGEPVPVDPGKHVIAASAPGRIEWGTSVDAIAEGTVVAVAIPDLAKVPEAHPVVVSNLGTLRVTTQPNAEILVDTVHVGVGGFEGKVKSGGHTLRVVAPGMRVYQAEILVGADETRAIDVPLEPMVVAVTVAPMSMPMPVPHDDGPGYQFAASAALGEKLHGDHPAVAAYRFEFSHHAGNHVMLGFFVEYGRIDASNRCGTDMPGPTPTTPFDFGPRNQFTSCWYVNPGLQLDVHFTPNRRFDPYIGISPGIRFFSVNYVPYDANGNALSKVSDTWPGLVIGTRLGVDYRPIANFSAWKIGAMFEVQFTALSNEQENQDSASHGTPYLTILGGIRSSIAF